MDKTALLSKQPDIYLSVKTHEEVLFEGKVSSVTGYNDTGTFDVLPSHTNFISLLLQKLTIRDISGVIKEIPVSNGVMRVRGDKIEVYLGIKT